MGRRPASELKRPKLGQNFLADARAAQKIVDALGDVSERIVIEIGPGRGALTGLLAQRARHLIAIELDRVLGAQLRLKYSKQTNIEVVEGDVLDVDFTSLVTRVRQLSRDMRIDAGERAVVVGNLPYYITSPILMHLFQYHDVLERMVVMVQKEVADRATTKPGSSEYGVLAASTQLFAKVERLFTLPPGAFSPPPKVYSTVLRLTMAPQAEALKVEPLPFIEFLKLSFGQKRKTLLNNLKDKFPPAAVKAALQAAGVKADARAEALSLAKAASVYRQLRDAAVRD